VLKVGGAIVIFSIIQSNKWQSGISKDILKKTAFSVFTHDPADSSWTFENSTTVYDTAQGVLTLHFINADNKLTVTQQLTPDPFTDVPNYLSILLSKLHQYAEIHTSIGTVGLTRPEELKGGQTAVINTRGTLMFAVPEKDLTNDQWQKFFNSLLVVK